MQTLRSVPKCPRRDLRDNDEEEENMLTPVKAKFSKKQTLTSTFMECWGRAWTDFYAAHWLHVHTIKAVYNSAASVAVLSAV